MRFSLCLQPYFLKIAFTCSFFSFNAHSIFPNFFWIFLTEKLFVKKICYNIKFLILGPGLCCYCFAKNVGFSTRNWKMSTRLYFYMAQSVNANIFDMHANFFFLVYFSSGLLGWLLRLLWIVFFLFVNQIHLIDFALFFRVLRGWNTHDLPKNTNTNSSAKYIMESSNQYFVNALSAWRISNPIRIFGFDSTYRSLERMNFKRSRDCVLSIYDYRHRRRRSMWSQHSLNSNDVDIFAWSIIVSHTISPSISLASHSLRSNCIQCKPISWSEFKEYVFVGKMNGKKKSIQIFINRIKWYHLLFERDPYRWLFAGRQKNVSQQNII